MTYYAVIDTNVIVSSMLKTTSIPGQVVDYVLTGEIVPLLNHDILDEYIDVLTRNEFGFDEKLIKDFISTINDCGVFLERTPTEEIFPDPDDAVFYEIVMTARNTTDAYLVTGNIKHFPAKPYVVTPKEMLEIMGK